MRQLKEEHTQQREQFKVGVDQREADTLVD